MIPFRWLRIIIRLERIVTTAARRVAVGCSCVAGVAWLAISTVALTGVAWMLGAVAMGVSVAVGAVCWLVSGE